MTDTVPFIPSAAPVVVPAHPSITSTLQAYWDRCLSAQRAADASSADLLGAALVDTRPTADEARDLAAYLSEAMS
jgi:hypothetical protein